MLVSIGTLIAVAGLITPIIKWLNSMENQNAINGERIKGIQAGLNALRQDFKEFCDRDYNNQQRHK